MSDYRIERIKKDFEFSSSALYREDVGYLLRHIAKLEPVAEAGRDLIDSLTGAVAYSSGKWTAHGKDRTLHVLTDAVARLYPDVPIKETGPSSGYDLRHMQDAVRAKLGGGSNE